jgi:hypothetical protein
MDLKVIKKRKRNIIKTQDKDFTFPESARGILKRNKIDSEEKQIKL